MASGLSGLIHTLKWAEYPDPRKGLKSKSPIAAHTHLSISAEHASFAPVHGSHPPQFNLVDNFHVSVSFTRDQSFVMKWVFDDSQQFQNDLLNHEQGHYNISALLARDCFVDVMLLKLLTFRTVEDGTAKVHQIKQGSLHKARAINDLYDKEIHPEQRSGNSRGPIQQSWDSFIQSAFTKARSTGTQSVDGIPHRVRLVDVLIQNGKRI